MHNGFASLLLPDKFQRYITIKVVWLVVQAACEAGLVIRLTFAFDWYLVYLFLI